MSTNITARSLVGMTMGSRKRKARYWMECERLHQKAQDLQEVVDRSVGRKSSLRTIGHTPISLRNHYRIGERLRPCPGCPTCEPLAVRQLRGWVTLTGLRLLPWKRIASEPCNGFTGRWSAGWTVHLQNGERIGGAWRDDNLWVAWETAAQHCLTELRKALGYAPSCDGSGVLPARKSKP